MNHQIQIISIEGNIGSGKSTLLANLKKHFKNNKHVVFLKEPVDEWSKIKDENNITILEKFYIDQEKYSFPFQMMAYISRLKLLKDSIKEIKDTENDFETKYVIITERSLYTDKMVFAKMLYDTCKIEYINYQIYLNWFNTFADDFSVNKIIYVKTEPEDNIPIDYLKSCSKYHDNMLDKNLSECVCKDQIVLNGNNNIYENESILNEWINSIQKFIYN